MVYNFYYFQTFVSCLLAVYYLNCILSLSVTLAFKVSSLFPRKQTPLQIKIWEFAPFWRHLVGRRMFQFSMGKQANIREMFNQ